MTTNQNTPQNSNSPRVGFFGLLLATVAGAAIGIAGCFLIGIGRLQETVHSLRPQRFEENRAVEKSERSVSNPHPVMAMKWRVYKDRDNPWVYIPYPEGGKVAVSSPYQGQKGAGTQAKIWQMTYKTSDYSIAFKLEELRGIGGVSTTMHKPYCVIAGNDFTGVSRFVEKKAENEVEYSYAYHRNGLYHFGPMIKNFVVKAKIKAENPEAFAVAKRVLQEIMRRFIAFEYPTLKFLETPSAGKLFIAKKDKNSVVFYRSKTQPCDQATNPTQFKPDNLPASYQPEFATISPYTQYAMLGYSSKGGDYRFYFIKLENGELIKCAGKRFLDSKVFPAPVWVGPATVAWSGGGETQFCNLRTHKFWESSDTVNAYDVWGVYRE